MGWENEEGKSWAGFDTKVRGLAPQCKKSPPRHGGDADSFVSKINFAIKYLNASPFRVLVSKR